MNTQKPKKLSLSVTHKMIARLAAVQAIYAYDMSNANEAHIMKVVDYYFDQEFRENELHITDQDLIPDKKFFVTLTKKVMQETNLLDEIITKYLAENWQLNKLSLVVKSILRLAVCELKFMPEIPTKVIINEYTNIAHAFYEDIEAGFVNGILDKISHIRDNKAADILE